MATNENKAALKQFGSAIIAGSRPGTIDVPVFDLNSNDLLSLFNDIRSENDQELKIGFSYSLSRQLEKNYKKYDESSQSQIKSALLSYAQTIKNEKELFGILAALDSLSTMCSGNWPELISFIFSDTNPESNDHLRSHILDSMKFIRDESFINKHSQKLISLIQRFLKLDLPNLSKSMFLSILALCLQDKNEENSSLNQVSMTEELFNEVWNVAVEIANTPNYRSVYPALQQLCQNVQNFRNHQSFSVKKIAETFSDSSSDLESRLTAVIPLLRLFPFLDDQTILNVIIPSALECLTSDYFASMSIIDHIGETDVELFENDLIISIWVLLFKEISENTYKRNAAIALFAPLADQIVNTVDDSFNIMTTTIIASLKAINDSQISQELAQLTALIAVTTLRSIILRFESPNPDLFHSLLPLIITSDDENLLIEANKAMRELLETGIFSTPEYEKELIDLYPKFDDTRVGFFSKLIKSLVNGSDDPGLALAEPIYDFALPFLSKESKSLQENALGLDIFALLAEISTDFVEDQVQDGLDIATNVLNSNEAKYFPPAALFLSAISVPFAEQSREAILKLLPRLLCIVRARISNDEPIKIEPKQLSSVALSTCEIVKEFDLRDTSSELSQIAINMLMSKDGFHKINHCGAEMLNVLAKCLLPDDASTAFKMVTQYLSENNTDNNELDNEITEDLIHAMKKILKKYKSVTFDDAQQIMKRLFGQFGGIRGLPSSIEMIEDPETYVFSFIKTFIIRFKNNPKVLSYIKSLMAIADIIDNEVLPSLLDPIETAIDNKLLDEKDVSKFFEQIISTIDVDDSDITTSLLTAITSIVRSYIQVVDIPKMINLLNFLWDNVDETEEDVELPMAIAMLTLELYSNTEENENENGPAFDEQLLIDLLAILPLPADVCDLEHVICSVLKIADKKWAQSKPEILMSLCIFMTRVCLMKKSEIEPYDLSSGVVADLRDKLKKIVGGNKEIQDQIKAEFPKNADKITALLK